MTMRSVTTVGLVFAFWCTCAGAFLSTPSNPHHHRYPFWSARTDYSDVVGLTQDTGSADDSDDFQRRCQVHKTLCTLREQLPTLLVQPLSEDDTSTYSSDFSLVGSGGEELASDYEELVSLSTTLVAATAAARQANALASSLSGNATTDFHYIVDCQLAVDNNLDVVRVQWKVDLPLGQRVSILEGLSDLFLDETGKIHVHRLQDVTLDGKTLNSVGETLATLRTAVRRVSDSPLLTTFRESPLGASLLSDIRNGIMEQATRGEDIDNQPLPPLYVTDSATDAFTDSSSNMTLVDDMSTPLPGSLDWDTFSSSRQSITTFVEEGLPTLSGQGFSTRDDFAQWFASDAQLQGLDGILLARGGERIAEFYRTMSSLEKGSDWRMQQVSPDYKSRSVTVKWIVTAPIKLEGTDRFILSEDDEPVVQTIEPVELKVGGNRVRDPEWFRTFVSTVESGRSNMGVDRVMELLQQAGRPSSSTRVAEKADRVVPPTLKPEAAASVHGIMCALHRDLPTLADANPVSPPAGDYLSSNVELRGYLDELLARGRISYSQLFRVLTGSLRGALLTGRVIFESPPIPKIEFTPQGTIRVSLELKLKFKVTPGDVDTRMGVPLTIETVSEYTVNSEGKIKEHKLIETRVNGQLTPGDVVSRWIKGPMTASGEEDLSVQSMLDALSWARNFASGNRQ